MPGDRVHLSVDGARALGEAALRGVGYDAEEAWIITDHVIDAALCGYEYSGLAKLLNLVESKRFALPRQPMKVVRETAVSALFDAGNNNGMLALYHATKGAIAKAASLGIVADAAQRRLTQCARRLDAEMNALAGHAALSPACCFLRRCPDEGPVR